MMELAIPPAGIDEWTQGNDGISFLSEDFTIMQYPGGIAAAWYGEIDLGEHPSTRGAITACRDVASVLRHTRRHGPLTIGSHREDPEPLPEWTPERYEIELLKRRINPDV